MNNIRSDWVAALGRGREPGHGRVRRAARRSGAISVAAQCHGLVLLDAHGEVLRAAKLWNDTTGAPNLARLVERIGARRWVMRIGTLPTAAFTIAKLAWVAEHEPGLLDRVATDAPAARLPDLLADRREGDRPLRRVRHRILRRRRGTVDSVLSRAGGRADGTGPPNCRPCSGPPTPRARSGPPRAALLGIGDDVVVGAGGGDQHAAYLGLGLTDGDQYFSIGTSGVVATSSRGPVFDTTGAVDGVADMTGGYLPLMSTLNAARVVDRAAVLLGTDLAGISELALAAGPTQGPVLVPFLDGERTPDRPDARGAFADLTSQTTREELARAFVEGPLLSLHVRPRQPASHAVSKSSGAATAVGGGSPLARDAATAGRPARRRGHGARRRRGDRARRLHPGRRRGVARRPGRARRPRQAVAARCQDPRRAARRTAGISPPCARGGRRSRRHRYSTAAVRDDRTGAVAPRLSRPAGRFGVRRDRIPGSPPRRRLPTRDSTSTSTSWRCRRVCPPA